MFRNVPACSMFLVLSTAVRQVRSNCVISFMALSYYSILTGTDFQARKLRFLSWQRFLQVLYFSAFFLKSSFDREKLRL